MLCGLVTREDHFSPAVASAEVIRVVPPFMAIPASAGIFFLYREHPRSVRLEIWDPYYTLAEKKNGLRTSFREGETVCFRWCGQQDLNLHGISHALLSLMDVLYNLGLIPKKARSSSIKYPPPVCLVFLAFRIRVIPGVRTNLNPLSIFYFPGRAKSGII